MACQVDAANPAEAKHFEPLINSGVTQGVPPRLVHNRTDDREPLREWLAQRGIELVGPHREGRIREPTPNGCKLMPYRNRGRIESNIARLPNFRRTVAGYNV